MPRPSSSVRNCRWSSGPSATALPETEPPMLVADCRAQPFELRNVESECCSQLARRWIEPGVPAEPAGRTDQREIVCRDGAGLVAADRRQPMTEWGRADRPRRQRRSAGRLPNRQYLPPRQRRDRRRRDARLPLDRCRWSSVRTDVRSSARVLRSTSAASDQSSSWPKRTASAPPLANASCLSWPWPVSAMRVRGSSSAPLGVIAIFAATWPAPEPENSTPDATRSAVSTGRCFRSADLGG